MRGEPRASYLSLAASASSTKGYINMRWRRAPLSLSAYHCLRDYRHRHVRARGEYRSNAIDLKRPHAQLARYSPARRGGRILLVCSRKKRYIPLGLLRASDRVAQRLLVRFRARNNIYIRLLRSISLARSLSARKRSSPPRSRTRRAIEIAIVMALFTGA